MGRAKRETGGCLCEGGHRRLFVHPLRWEPAWTGGRSTKLKGSPVKWMLAHEPGWHFRAQIRAGADGMSAALQGMKCRRALVATTHRPCTRAFPRKPDAAHTLDTEEEKVPMLWTVAVVLLVLWGLGLLTSYTMGGFIHILLVLAIVTVLIRVIQGRKVLS